jgi:hypothetical protein
MAAVSRLETGTPIRGVSSACEVNPNVLHRWPREFRDGWIVHFRAGEEEGRWEPSRRTGP